MDQGFHTVKLCRVPDGTELRLSVSPNITLQTLSTIIDEKTNTTDSPYRFVLRGNVCPTWRTILDLQLNQEDTIYYLKEGAQRFQHQPPQLSPANRLVPADPVRDLLESPVLQSLLDNPNLMMAIIESNPHINAMRERSPEINSLFDDPQAITDLFRTMRNPVMARELIRSTDRALSNVDAMPGGFDALRQLYHEVQEPAWDSLLNSHNNRTQNTTERRDYRTDGTEQNQPFPQAWPQRSESDDLSAGQNESESITHGMNPFELPFLARYSGDSGNLGSTGMTIPQLMTMQSNARLDDLVNISDLWSRHSGSEQNNELAPPQERYRTQLEALRGMGFSDETQCLEALERNNGSVNRALDDLLQSSR